MYEIECWPVKKTFEHMIEVTEIRMLRWMSGRTLMYRSRNMEFREKLGVTLNSAKCAKIN